MAIAILIDADPDRCRYETRTQTVALRVEWLYYIIVILTS